MFRDYKDLIVWQKAMDLACEVPRIVKQLPKCEEYSLGDQMRRAVISVPANIAEGYGRWSRGEFIRFVKISNGSLRELETLLLLAQRRGLAEPEMLAGALDNLVQVARMLTALHRTLSASRSSRRQ
jgi:four helix bundle protein